MIITQSVSIPEIDKRTGEIVRGYIDTLTKPPGSLGRLEELAIKLAEITGQRFPTVTPPGVIVFAADHGITVEGVSAFPQEVTSQMVRNFLNGGAAINAFSRQIGAKLSIVDIGVASNIDHTGLVIKKIRYGTGNFCNEDAMSYSEAEQALEVGYTQGEGIIKQGVKCLILGEMGIGNTTTSSAILAALSGKDVRHIVGQGTGIPMERVLHKQHVIEKALYERKPNANNPIDLLSKVGGLEVAGMAGAMLAAAQHRIPILVDGFICTIAALIAKAISGQVSEYMIIGHRSVEPGHELAINLLGKSPLIDLGLRLGEGSGAAVAFPILQSATIMLKEMATFTSAGVSN
ncbi:nicotinate-nucleotide--dimethylbenzimidazole phosphoribosyltransferase [Pseudalkalibacillus decolorationis]|uniref:nicotinate-nucleotide--dimethylbenzimidazole phosphoribosyltransferase n=1 Tax=Pseudalkalibacillus decolorationis TaxID=163879 RepID=UPI0021473B41|nr:nicotinate-nucleotide--dimethylbenzimidazole phosphoribosyltransferase [Pseudalkalibacillus decolorationis]